MRMDPALSINDASNGTRRVLVSDNGLSRCSLSFFVYATIMDPYHRYLEYKKRTQDMYRLVRHRIAMYNQQQQHHRPDRILMCHDTLQRENIISIPVHAFTTIKQIQQRISNQLGSKIVQLQVSTPVSPDPSPRLETMFDYLCITDYSLQDGDKIYFTTEPSDTSTR